MFNRGSIGAIACAVFAVAAGCSARPYAPARQVIVIGVDGMDPGFVERHWTDLPSLARLRDQGSFTRLATTMPPQSPVAWSTFITGLDPAEHGIFDFVRRDPSTLEPALSMGETKDARFRIPLGPYELPLTSPRVVSLRQGKAFWQILEDHGIPATIVRIPVDYPPAEGGEALSGMGTPDLRGTEGSFTFYTDDAGFRAGQVAGGSVIPAHVVDGHVVLRLEGPPNSLRRDRSYAWVDVVIDIDPDEPLARIAAGEQMAIVRQGEWSDWIPVDFPLVAHLASSRGMFRVYAKQLHPHFELYVSPINVDPMAAALPISTPKSLGREVALQTGRYSTLGIPEDTSALRQGVFDLNEFLSDSRMVLNDERKLLGYFLDRFREGLLFFYFSSVDQNSHILWGQHDSELLEFYRAVDSSIGEVMWRKPSAELIVMSDHGFTSFKRAVNLNTWLYNEGFLALKSPLKGDEESLDNVDWSRTRAYAMGLNSLYLNLAGRERHGMVRRGSESEAVLEKIRERLLALHDPANGAAVAETVTVTNVRGDDAQFAPDLIVGYSPGYRASWQTGLGGFSRSVLEDNDDPWIADHCINAADVPGVLFSSRKLQAANPELKDLPVSLLAGFGIRPGEGMSGRSIF